MVDEEDAAEAFGILGDATRIRILRTFAEVVDERDPSQAEGMPTLTFSEIYDRSGVDSTSRLSYHLDELDGTYVRQTDDGWSFTFAGNAIVRLVLSGAYAGDVEVDPFETEGECPFCGSERISATVEERVLLFVCQECGGKTGASPVTPAQVESRDPESLVASTTTRTVEMFRQFREGICSECGGVVDVDVEGHQVSDDVSESMRFVTVGRCRQCWWNLNAPPALWMANHPASVAFHWDNGVDVLSRGPQEAVRKLGTGEWATERTATDSPEYEVSYRVGPNVLRMTVDDDLELLRTERVRRETGDDRRRHQGGD